MRRQDERLRAAAARPGDADARRVHVGQLGEEVEGADAVPRLQAHEALQPQLGLGVGEALAVRTSGLLSA